MTRRVDTVQLEHKLFDHDKIFEAGKYISGKKDGRGMALGFYTAAVLYASNHLTDGYLSTAVLEGFPHADHPLAVADALAKAGLFDRENGGFRIHDFDEHNPSAAEVKQRRRADRLRKRRERGH